MRKILLVFSELFYGGAEKQVRGILEGLVRAGFCVAVSVTGAHNHKKGFNGIEQKFIQGYPDVNFYYNQEMYFPKGLVSKIRLAGKYHKIMLEILKKEKPDTVFMYNGIELSAARMYKQHNMKVVFSERESGDRGALKLLRYKYFFRYVDKIV